MDGGGDLDNVGGGEGGVIGDGNLTLNRNGSLDIMDLNLAVDDGSIDGLGSLEDGGDLDWEMRGGRLQDSGVVSGDIAGLSIVDLLGDDGLRLVDSGDSGYNTRILKPATPHLPIQVPTVLKGTQTVNAPIIDSQVEVHNVQTPVLVERKVAIPYDAPFTTTNIVKVPTPVHVDAPYNAPYPVPVQGEPIIKKSVAPAVVTHSNHVAHHQEVCCPRCGDP